MWSLSGWSGFEPGTLLKTLLFFEAIPWILLNIFHVPEVIFAQVLLVSVWILSSFPRTSRCKHSEVALFLQLALFVFIAVRCSSASKCQKTENSSSSEERYKNETFWGWKHLFSLHSGNSFPAQTKTIHFQWGWGEQQLKIANQNVLQDVGL